LIWGGRTFGDVLRLGKGPKAWSDLGSLKWSRSGGDRCGGFGHELIEKSGKKSLAGKGDWNERRGSTTHDLDRRNGGVELRKRKRKTRRGELIGSWINLMRTQQRFHLSSNVGQVRGCRWKRGLHLTKLSIVQRVFSLRATRRKERSRGQG